jgi:RNA polymerase sporulation-specific sigma factor
VALVREYRRGNKVALNQLLIRYHQFVRLKASSYFLAGGDAEDLIQEGMVGLYKAVRDFREDREASFRSFAELCITRQIITAIKTATRQKHQPLNGYVSLSAPPAETADDSDCSLADILPGPSVHDPVNQVISTEEIESLKVCLTEELSELEGKVLRLYLRGLSYEAIANGLGCDCKTVDNALQRIKRKVDTHLARRQVVN